MGLGFRFRTAKLRALRALGLSWSCKVRPFRLRALGFCRLVKLGRFVSGVGEFCALIRGLELFGVLGCRERQTIRLFRTLK